MFDTSFAAIYKIGDCSLSLSKAKKPVTGIDDRIDVYWEVDDIDAAFRTLIEKGATSLTPVTQVLNIRIAKVVDPFGNVIGLTGDVEPDTNRTVENKPSETAMSVAFCRALFAKDNRDEIKGADYLAEIFLTDEAKKLLQDEKSQRWAVQNLITSPLYGYLIARTSYIDSVFIRACNTDIKR